MPCADGVLNSACSLTLTHSAYYPLWIRKKWMSGWAITIGTYDTTTVLSLEWWTCWNLANCKESHCNGLSTVMSIIEIRIAMIRRGKTITWIFNNTIPILHSRGNNTLHMKVAGNNFSSSSFDHLYYCIPWNRHWHQYLTNYNFRKARYSYFVLILPDHTAASATITL